MRIVIFLLFVASLAACKKSALTTQTLNEMPSDNAVLLAEGMFKNGPYGRVSGNAQVWRTPGNKYEVVLDSFTTSNGPDLYLYLSKEIMPVNFIEAGKLKSTNGSQVYALAEMPDLTQYKYIAVHCKAYNHLFGYASLP